MITQEKLKKILPNNKKTKELADSLNLVLPKYDINTIPRIAGFLGQCAVESAEFNILLENLNYSAQGLHKTWPRLFPTVDSAVPYAHKPEKIANRVYSNRIGNGPESSGDGWKYRGRGAIQTTGKENYTSLANYLEKSIDETISYCETMDGAIASACFYWKKRGLNIPADGKDIKRMTYLVNGGYHGLDQRTKYWNSALNILGQP